MAIIYSYPKKTTPNAGDFLVITDSEQPAPNKNRTKSLTIGDLAKYVITSQSAITGGGTLNTIPMFTPDGQKIGDSIITQLSNASNVTITGNATVTSDLTCNNEISTDTLLVNDDADIEGQLAVSDTATFSSTSKFFGNVTLENSGLILVNNSEEYGFIQAGSQSIDFYIGDPVASNPPLSSELVISLTNTEAVFKKGVKLEGYLKDGTGGAGAAGQVLSSTGTGVAWVSDGGGTVTYTSSTVDKMPKWSAPGVLSDTAITNSGGTTSVGGNLSSGDSNSISGNYSAAFGYGNTVTGVRSGGLGANNTVAGGQVWATGDSNDVGIDLLNVGGNIVTSGFNNNVKSGNSCVVGTGNTLTNTTQSATISRNFVLGSSNTLNDVMDSISIGFSNTINNDDSCIFGKNNTTSATDTYAVGKGNTLTSINDYAFGLNNNISGNGVIAMAIGQANVLAGKQSYAFGRELVDGGEDDTVILGRFNAAPTATGRIVFGTGFNDTTGRKNAIEIQAGNGTTSGLLFSALRISASYNSNAEATAGGVENAELYRSNNQVRINTNQTQQDARNNEGFIFLTPRVKIISSGESFNYDANYNLLKLNWSGANGTATVALPNPNLTDTKNRVLQCLTDGTFNANISINFNSSGILINGSVTKTITGAYQSIKFWSDGTQWYILNQQT